MRIIIVDPHIHEVYVTLIDTENPEEIGYREYKGKEGLDAQEIVNQIVGLAHLGNADEIWIEPFGVGSAIYDNLKYLEDNKAGHFKGTVKATHIKSARAVVNNWSRADREKEEEVPDNSMYVSNKPITRGIKL